MERVGDRLRLRREGLGWTQAELAKRSGVPQQTIAGIESPKRNIKRPREAPELAVALRVHLSWLLTGDGPMEAEANELPRSQPVGVISKIPIIGTIGHDRTFGIAPMQEEQFVNVGFFVDPLDLWEAILVKGAAIQDVYGDGTILLYQPTLLEDISLLVGRECVVELSDGRRFVRRPYPSREVRGYWDLEGHFDGTIESQKLRWATPIRLIQVWQNHSDKAA